MSGRVSYVLLVVVSAGLSGSVLAQDGFEPLFDGETLKGWSGKEGLWSVRDGAIVGNSGPDGIRGNTFLVHEKPFEDFTLRLEFKLLGGNSGVQFRSRYDGEPSEFVIRLSTFMPAAAAMSIMLSAMITGRPRSRIWWTR